MINLFVCHTQANLLLACGLSKGRFKDDENHLILFIDFDITEDLKSILNVTFEKVLYRSGTYPAINKTWKKKIKKYPVDLYEIKSVLKSVYHRVFEVCDDSIPELYILKYTYKKNKNTNYCWLEDGSFPYFKNTTNLSGFSKNTFTRTIRKIIFKYLLGLGKFYSFDGDYMGSNHILKTAYLTFPGLQREIYNSKRIIGITNEEFNIGITTLYPVKAVNQLNDGDALIVLDKLDVYRDLNKVRHIIRDLINLLQEKRYKIYYKYHPREESFLEELNTCNEIYKDTGIENIYSASKGKTVTIIGIKSTGLQTAIKMGFHTISIAKIVNEVNNDICEFYNKIGVEIIDTIEVLNSLRIESKK